MRLITKREFPPWLKKRLPSGNTGAHIQRLIADLRLNTVCQSAHCPNMCECFDQGTATFMILGDNCTRNCGFCAIPHEQCLPPDPQEPERLAEAALLMGLRYVVITSVTRDDLPDSGAGHFRDTIVAIRDKLTCAIEVLTPDFKGQVAAIREVASAKPDVYNHNVETIPRLYPRVRPGANYCQSLDLLALVNNDYPGVATKSGIMVGLGETPEEILEVCRDLRKVGCDMLTIGQYLQPDPTHLPVQRYVTPNEFAEYASEALEMGFLAVASDPFVRSSYHAGEMFNRIALSRH